MQCLKCTKTIEGNALHVFYNITGDELGRICEPCEKNFSMDGFNTADFVDEDDDDDDFRLDRIEIELHTLRCQSEDCILIDDANDLMDAVQDQVDEMNDVLEDYRHLGLIEYRHTKDIPTVLLRHITLSSTIDTIRNNLYAVLDKDNE